MDRRGNGGLDAGQRPAESEGAGNGWAWRAFLRAGGGIWMSNIDHYSDHIGIGGRHIPDCTTRRFR